MSLPTFSFTTTAEEVADVFSAEIKGKNVLITGTSLNGIGFEAARVIAKHANLVVITGYNDERLKLSEEAIMRETPSANIRRLTLDLSSFAAVHKAAEEVNAYPEPLHVLINNAAAAAAGPFKLTVDKLETQMATGHLGPFLLTKLLVPKLLAAGTESYVPRVVFVSSDAHAMGTGPNLATITRPDAESYKLFEIYSQVKSANILTTRELSKRSNGRINVYSLHPGAIYTNIMETEESQADLKAAGLLGPDGKPSTQWIPVWKTIPQGAATTVTAAFDPRLNDKPGAYLDDSKEANHKLASHISEPEIAEKLWAVSEEVVGEKFAFN
ncbi:hypothetical protein B0H15DRAFT_855091 [Mycena belliarum]|uniref:Uncharacterized protein n=1 Tax=Mycena belliarum TaxID=1033014 RepID=A0AAD6XM89_9AGAR|nr:hypothetical protein B0H15DRAFT_855091 [Mycena belliae]